MHSLTALSIVLQWATKQCLIFPTRGWGGGEYSPPASAPLSCSPPALRPLPLYVGRSPPAIGCWAALPTRNSPPASGSQDRSPPAIRHPQRPYGPAAEGGGRSPPAIVDWGPFPTGDSPPASGPRFCSPPAIPHPLETKFRTLLRSA